jgi:hypothetical protein
MLNFNPQLIKTTQVAIKRFGSGYYDRGKWVLPDAEEIPVMDVILHPTKAKDTLQLKESDRNSESITVFTSLQLVSIDEGENSADIILWDNKEFKVMKVYKAVLGTVDHYKAIAVRLKRSLTGGTY